VLGRAFPIRHRDLDLVDTFNPFYEGSGFAWGPLAIVAACGIAAIVSEVRMFR
jgi:hypothetical protein